MFSYLTVNPDALSWEQITGLVGMNILQTLIAILKTTVYSQYNLGGTPRFDMMTNTLSMAQLASCVWPVSAVIQTMSPWGFHSCESESLGSSRVPCTLVNQ